MPPVVPSPAQVALLMISAALFAASGGASLAASLRERGKGGAAAGDTAEAARRLRRLSQSASLGAIVVGLGVLVWRAASRGSGLPLEDNFDAFVWVGLLLAMFVAYVQRRRPIGGLDWFVAPLVVLLLVAAAVFGRTRPHEYLPTTWSLVHRSFAYGATVSLFVAGAAGAMYLYGQQRLKGKFGANAPKVANLERLEHLTFVAVTLGFALLTVSMVMGLARLITPASATSSTVGWFSPKVLTGLAVWVIYAIVLHAPINPRFRGRKVALLSVIGFILLIFTVVFTQFTPNSSVRNDDRGMMGDERNYRSGIADLRFIAHHSPFIIEPPGGTR